MYIKLTIILLFIVALGGGLWYVGLINPPTPLESSAYSAVYMLSGDVYFGALAWTPEPSLKNAWFLQRVADGDGREQIRLTPLTAVFWGPTDTINLSRNQIIFWTRLRNDSEVAKAIANPDSVRNGATPALEGELQNLSTPPPPALVPAPDAEAPSP